MFADQGDDEQPLSPATKRALLWGVIPFVGALRNTVAAVRAVRAGTREARPLLGIAVLDVLAMIATIVVLASSAAALPQHSRERRMIGVRISAATGGVRVDVVEPDSPAEIGGVRVGDLIEEIDGRPVVSIEQAVAAIQEPGSRSLRVRRGDDRTTIVVRPKRARSLQTRASLVDVWQPEEKAEGRATAWKTLYVLLLPAALLVAVWALRGRRASLRTPAFLVATIVAAGGASLFSTRLLERAFHGMTWAAVLTGIVTFSAGLLAGAVAMWRRRERLQIATPGWPAACGAWRPSNLPARRWAKAGFFASILIAPRTFVIGAAVSTFAKVANPGANPTQLMQAMPGSAVAIFGIVAVLLAPVAEELLFRGVLQGWLRGLVGAPAAIAVAAAVFALVHVPQYGSEIVTVLALGCILGWVRERSGTLRAPIAVHAANNAVSFAVTTVLWLFG